jgi:hypothetical protein
MISPSKLPEMTGVFLRLVFSGWLVEMISRYDIICMMQETIFMQEFLGRQEQLVFDISYISYLKRYHSSIYDD